MWALPEGVCMRVVLTLISLAVTTSAQEVFRFTFDDIDALER